MRYKGLVSKSFGPGQTFRALPYSAPEIHEPTIDGLFSENEWGDRFVEVEWSMRDRFPGWMLKPHWTYLW